MALERSDLTGLGRGRFRLLRREKGFTLIETLVAVAILAAIGVVFLRAIDTNSRASRILDEQVVGSNLATAYFEAIKQLTYDNTPPEYEDAGASITIPSGYIVDIDADYSDDSTRWFDTWSTANQTLQKISVIVSRDGGKTVFSICTFRTQF